MKTKIVMLLVWGVAIPTIAGDFSLIALKAPQTSVGAFISMDGSGSASGAVLGAVTYKALPSNNVLKSLISGWVPLTIGGTMGNGLGGPSIAAGTGVNLLPAAKAGLLGIISAMAKPGALESLKTSLQASDSSVSVFVGPQYNLIFSALDDCRGRPTWFIGTSIKWE